MIGKKIERQKAKEMHIRLYLLTATHALHS